jgi:hypothetical protein
MGMKSELLVATCGFAQVVEKDERKLDMVREWPYFWIHNLDQVMRSFRRHYTT